MLTCLSSQLNALIEKYNIEPSNVYNCDEKGFLIGLGRTAKRVVTKETLQSKKIAAIHDGNREFISLIAGISADGMAIPPALIYKRGGDIQDT